MITKRNLIEENNRLKRKIFVLENIGVSINSDRKEKKKAIFNFQKKFQGFTDGEVCKIINLNRGTYFNYKQSLSTSNSLKLRDEYLYKEIKKVFDDSNQLYGTEKIYFILRKNGIICSCKKISQIMKNYGMKKRLVITRPKKQVSISSTIIDKNLINRQFKQNSPNKVWVSDSLELKIGNVKYYLCVILDLFSRKVIAWRISHQKNYHLTLNTFKDAFSARNEPQDLIFHTDRGAEFIANEFTETLQFMGVKQSFSYPGSPYDNACMEGFYSLLRREETNINIRNYTNSKVIEEYLNKYFDYYNNKRIHLRIGGCTPQEKEDEYYKNK